MDLMITGHREIDESVVRPVLTKAFERKADEVSCFIFGGARGTDILAAEIVLETTTWPLQAFIPFPGFEAKWTMAERQRLYRVLGNERVADIVYIDSEYSKGIYLRRNWAMVKSADFAIAIYEDEKSGTGHTVRALQEKSVPSFAFNPTTRKWGRLA